MPKLFESSQRLLKYDDAGMYEPTEMLLAATGWLLQAARDADTTARAGTRLAHVAAAVATSTRDFVGDAFENAVVDLLSHAHHLLPQLRQAVAIVLGYSDFAADFSEPRVIALVTNRHAESLLRATPEDARRLVSDDAVVLTPRMGKPVAIWTSSHDRLGDLLKASTSGRTPRSLAKTPSVSKLHFADILLGSSDGTAWLGVDLKSGKGRCTTTNSGIHLGISEQVGLSIMDSDFVVHEEYVPGRGKIPTFVEVRLGTFGTPIGRIRDAVELMESVAALRAGTDVWNIRGSEAGREALARLKPYVEHPLDEVIETLLPWSKQAVESIYVPTVGFDLAPQAGVTSQLI